MPCIDFSYENIDCGGCVAENGCLTIQPYGDLVETVSLEVPAGTAVSLPNCAVRVGVVSFGSMLNLVVC